MSGFDFDELIAAGKNEVASDEVRRRVHEQVMEKVAGGASVPPAAAGTAATGVGAKWLLLAGVGLTAAGLLIWQVAERTSKSSDGTSATGAVAERPTTPTPSVIPVDLVDRPSRAEEASEMPGEPATEALVNEPAPAFDSSPTVAPEPATPVAPSAAGEPAVPNEAAEASRPTRLSLRSSPTEPADPHGETLLREAVMASMRGEYETALRLFDQHEIDFPGEMRQERDYWRLSALCGASQPSEARALADSLLERYGETELSRRVFAQCGF